MSTALTWTTGSSILTLGAQRTLRSALAQLARAAVDWVVVVRTHRLTGEVFRYAWRASELQAVAVRGASPSLDETLEVVLNLHEHGASNESRRRREQPRRPYGAQGPASARTVDLDAAGTVVAVGELAEATEPPGGMLAPAPPAEFGRGGRRGGGRWFRYWIEPETSAAADLPTDYFPEIASTPSEWLPNRDLPEPKSSLSAQAPTEMRTGGSDKIQVRLEIEPEANATPLSHRITARTRPDQPVVVQLSIENDAIRVLGEREQRLPPPRPGQPQQAVFDIRAERSGSVRLAVTFRQGGSELGSIGLAVEVVDSAPAAGTTNGHCDIHTPDARDDELLDLLIEQRNDNGRLYYEYRLHCEALSLNFLTLQSKPLLDSGGAAAARAEQFVERIYDRVTREMKSFDDLSALQREVRALGTGLSDELFAPDVVRVLWPLRQRIGLIKITSWEPLIPWELLRLREPDSGDIDDRFLAEYGLVRALPGEAPARKLPLNDWRWLAGDYPMATHAPAGDMTWLTQTLALQHSLNPTQVAATANALFDTLADGQFDVLHLACHAESPLGKADSAVLIIGDEPVPGGSAARLIEADTATVKAEAKLRQRRPLVFLNACESGRVGAQLTAWGGWPEVFVRAGAGAFVGTAWAVRDKPATAFASTFYEALLNQLPLHEAASAARQAAKKLGDASWLAFKVYGDPRSRRA